MSNGLNVDDSNWLLESELKDLETRPDNWARYFWPSMFSRPFTAYQTEFWSWAEAIKADSPAVQPRVECEPRGVGKSTIGRTIAIYLMAKKIKSYILIVSATDNQARKHFAVLKKQLENPKLLAHYPHLRPQKSVHRNIATNWSANRIVTAEGQVIEFISVLGNARGFNTEEGRRLDLVLLDDIDDQKDSVDVTTKKLDIIGSNILGAGAEYTDIIYLQNLIHRTSICTLLRDNNAGILVNRKFVGPFPLCRVFAYKEEKIEGDNTGAKNYVLTDFQPFDPATSREYVQTLLNRLGPKVFQRECQQDLTVVDEDKDFREYSEIHHVITYSEFFTYWKRNGVNVLNEKRDRLLIPVQWNVGLGHDWGTTVEHPAAIAPVARPNRGTVLSDSFFVFGEVVTPHYPRDVNAPVQPVSPGRVALAEKDHLKKWNVDDSQITLRLMSHEASAALNSYAEDLTEDLKVHYGKWKAARGSGVPQLQQVLEIDFRKEHPFRRYPLNHPDESKRGTPIKGSPRFFILVPDSQGELKCDEAGHLYVAQPINADGCARLRGEMPVYSQRNTGKSKIFDDMVDALRGLMGEYAIIPQGLTSNEQYQQMLAKHAPELLLENIEKIESEEERSLLHANERVIRAEFEEKVRQSGRVPDGGILDRWADEATAASSVDRIVDQQETNFDSDWREL